MSARVGLDCRCCKGTWSSVGHQKGVEGLRREHRSQVYVCDLRVTGLESERFSRRNIVLFSLMLHIVCLVEDLILNTTKSVLKKKWCVENEEISSTLSPQQLIHFFVSLLVLWTNGPPLLIMLKQKCFVFDVVQTLRCFYIIIIQHKDDIQVQTWNSCMFHAYLISLAWRKLYMIF